MKRILTILLAAALAIALAGCARNNNNSNAAPENSAPANTNNAAAPENAAPQKEAEMVLTLKIGETPVSVAWESNESVDALKAMAEKAPVKVQMSRYGGFEQVGSLGQRLPSGDKQTTTQPGDIVLYNSSNIVIFYGSNSWSYTRLGHVTDKNKAELTELLGSKDVVLSIDMAPATK